MMKFSLPRTDLLRTLDITSGAIDRKSTKPILANVLLQAKHSQLRVTTSDMSIEMVAQIDHVTIEQEGETTIPGKKLHDIIKTAPDDSMITLHEESNRVLITYGRSRFELSTLPADDYPVLENGPLDNSIDMLEGSLAKMMHKVAFAMAANDVRYYLNGMLFDITPEQYTFVATDGHRLAIASMEVEGTENVSAQSKIIVPRKTIQEFSRLLSQDAEGTVKIQMDNRHIRLSKDAVQITSKLIDSNYPDYRMAIPKSFMKNLELDRAELRAAITRVSILSNDRYKAILLSLNEGVMSLNSNNPELEKAEEKIDINYHDEPFEVGYNANYLLDALSSLEGESVLLNLNNDQSSTEIRAPDDDAVRYIVMPVKI